MPLKPKEPLNSRRLAIAEAVFAKFAKDEAGTVSLSDMKKIYDVTRHPRVLDGTCAETQAMEMFGRHFPRERVTWQEFHAYCVKVSNEVDMGRALDADAYFELVLTQTWRLDEDAKQKLPKTNIVPISMEKPGGLLATQRLDIVWADEDGKLVGYRGVVDPVFARMDLPENIRGHFALQDESDRMRVKFLPVQAALLPPLDLVWEVEEDCGVWAGMSGIVLSNIIPTQLPESLRNHIVPRTQSLELNVHFLEYQRPRNPQYERSSQVYGKGAVLHCQQLIDLKRKVWEGKSGGFVFAGRTGKFTRDFTCGPYRDQGLNITSKPHQERYI